MPDVRLELRQVIPEGQEIFNMLVRSPELRRNYKYMKKRGNYGWGGMEEINLRQVTNAQGEFFFEREEP
jgi:hypothetical protein